MPHPVGKKEESRAKILNSAGRGFRALGFGGIGVDGLAKGAGVTSGAFYAHFRSKADAFREAVVVGLQDLRAGLERFRATDTADWAESFVDFYLSDRRTCALEESCALQSLTGEVSRADPEVRQAYEAELRKVIEVLATGMPDEAPADRRGRATALLALLAGGVSMSRAVKNPRIASEIAASVRKSALALAKGRE